MSRLPALLGAFILLGAALPAAPGFAAPHGKAHPKPNVTFTLPTGLALGPKGGVYVAENQGRIQKVSKNGQVLARLGGTGTQPGQFQNLNLLALDRAGNLYAADTGNNRIQKLSTSGTPLAQWGAGANGPGEFNHPYGVAVDASGAVYVTDTFNDRIVKLSPSGQVLAIWGAGVGLEHPSAIAVDAHGQVYVADSGAGRIDVFSPDGRIDRQIQGVQKPCGVAVDAKGNVYVADRAANQIRKFSSTGRQVAHWGKAGSGKGAFNFRSQIAITGLAVNTKGEVFVADTANNRVQILSPNGKVDQVWGKPAS